MLFGLMSISRSWALVAPWPALAAIVMYVTSNARVRWLLRCQYHRPNLLGYTTLAAGVLVLFAFVATMMFASEAARNPELHPAKRVVWLLAIVIGSPLTVPLYWALHIQRRV